MKTKAAQMLAPDLLARKATGKPSCCLLSGSPAGTCPCWLLHVTTIQLISWDLSKIDGGLGRVAGRIVYTSRRDHHRSHLCWGRGSDEHADQDSPPHTHALLAPLRDTVLAAETHADALGFTAGKTTDFSFLLTDRRDSKAEMRCGFSPGGCC